MRLLSGSSHPVLAQEIAEALNIKLSPLELSRFPDGEISLRLVESVRGEDVFVLQSIALDPNNYLMELLVIIDALKRASAKSITAVLPYYGYGRQDRKDKPREPITAKLVADLLSTAGITHALTVDMHTGQLEGFFDLPVDHIHCMPVLAQAFKKLINPSQLVVVAPDIGSVKLAHKYASYLNANFAIVDKQRLTASQVGVAGVIGDVKNCDILLADDMCSTGGTLVSAAKACQEKGARRVFAVVSHGLFVDEAIERIEESPIEALLISNTVPYTDRIASSKKIQTISIGNLLGQAIRCVETQAPLSSIYTERHTKF